MTLPAFEYVAPRTVADAVAELAARGPDAKVLAGGQSLIPLLSLRVVRPSVVVDIGRIESLRYIEIDGGVLRIGALARHRDLERSPAIARVAPILSAAARYIGHSHVRNRGTIAGSLAHADPAAEWPAVLLALDATVAVTGPRGERALRVDQLITGPLTTALAHDELITEVRVPIPPAGHGWAFQEFAIRSGDFALASAAVLIAETPDGGRAVRVVVGGATPAPVRCGTAEAAVKGPSADAAAWQSATAAAGVAAAAEVDAADDQLASAAYRRRIVAILVRDALLEAAGRAGTAAAEARA